MTVMLLGNMKNLLRVKIIQESYKTFYRMHKYARMNMKYEDF